MTTRKQGKYVLILLGCIICFMHGEAKQMRASEIYEDTAVIGEENEGGDFDLPQETKQEMKQETTVPDATPQSGQRIDTGQQEQKKQETNLKQFNRRQTSQVDSNQINPKQTNPTNQTNPTKQETNPTDSNQTNPASSSKKIPVNVSENTTDPITEENKSQIFHLPKTATETIEAEEKDEEKVKNEVEIGEAEAIQQQDEVFDDVNRQGKVEKQYSKGLLFVFGLAGGLLILGGYRTIVKYRL